MDARKRLVNGLVVGMVLIGSIILFTGNLYAKEIKNFLLKGSMSEKYMVPMLKACGFNVEIDTKVAKPMPHYFTLPSYEELKKYDVLMFTRHCAPLEESREDVIKFIQEGGIVIWMFDVHLRIKPMGWGLLGFKNCVRESSKSLKEIKEKGGYRLKYASPGWGDESVLQCNRKCNFATNLAEAKPIVVNADNPEHALITIRELGKGKVIFCGVGEFPIGKPITEYFLRLLEYLKDGRKDIIALKEFSEEKGAMIIEDYENKASIAPGFFQLGYGSLDSEITYSTEKVHRGNYSLKAHYVFKSEKGKTEMFFVNRYWLYLRSSEGKIEKVGAWVYGDGSGCGLNFIMQDIDKRRSLYDVYPGPKIDWQGWKYVEVDIPPSSSPLIVTGIKIMPPKGISEGTIYIDDLTAIARLKSDKIFTVNISPDKRLKFYSPGESVRLDIRIRNNSYKSQEDVTVRYKITDFWSKKLKEKAMGLGRLKPLEEKSFSILYRPDSKGIYYINFEVKNPNTGALTRKEGSFGILVSNKGWKPKNEEQKLFFGVKSINADSSHSWDYHYQIDTVAAIGIKMCHVHPWTAMLYHDPKKDIESVCKKRKIDDLVFYSKKCGMDLFYGINTSSMFRKDKNGNEIVDFDAYQSYLLKVVNRYKDTIKYWEVGNEADICFTSSPTWGENYLNLLKTTYQTIKKLDPEAKIVSAGMCGPSHPRSNKAQLVKWFSEGKDYVDIVAAHHYGRRLIKPLHGMEKYCPDKPRWNSEAGVDCGRGSGKAGERMQAEWLIKKIVNAKSTGWQAYYWYLPVDVGLRFHGDCLRLHYENYFGLLTIDHFPKASVFAYNTLIKELKNTEPIGEGEIDLGKDISVHGFKGEKKYIYCLWAKSFASQICSLKGKIKNVKLVDIMGNEKILQANNGTITLSLGELPVFLESDKELFSLSDSLVSFSSLFNVFPDRESEFQVKINNIFTETLAGSVSIKAAEGWKVEPGIKEFKIAEGKALPIYFKIKPCSEIETGVKYPVDLSIKFRDSRISPVNVSVFALAPPLVRKVLKPIVVDGNLSDWPKDITPIKLNKFSQVIDMGERGWKGEDELSAEVYTCWDEGHFYLGVMIKDDIYLPMDKSGRELWKNDGAVQFAIVPEGEGKHPFYFYSVALAPEGAQIYCHYALSEHHTSTGLMKKIKVKITKKPRGMIYELSIPFSEITPLMPETGKSFGFAIVVFDLEGTAGLGISKKCIEWPEGSGITIGGRTSEHFGSLIFAE